MQAHRVDFEWRDFAKQALTKAELEDIIDPENVTAFLNPRHRVFKANNWKNTPPSKSQAISSILKDPNVLRRPLIRTGNRYIVGFDREAYAKLK